MNTIDRTGFDNAIRAMTTVSDDLGRKYAFYLFMVSQCRIQFDLELPAPAAVNFEYDHYNLFINPTTYNPLPLTHRVGVIKHEMLHIILRHIERREDRDPKLANYAMDLAVNEDIDPDHLPSWAVNHKNMSTLLGFTIPQQQTFETYYDLLIPHADKLPDYEAGHSKPSKGDEVIAQHLAKAMVEKSFNETNKARGDLPSAYNSWIELLSSSQELDWKQLIRRIAANRRTDRRSTILRPNRRQPNLSHLKGRVKDRRFDFLFVVDVSGSMSDSEVAYCLSESINLLKLTNSTATMIQVDTDAYPPEPLKSTTRQFTRKARGGTWLSPALDVAAEHNLSYDAIIVLTDGGVCSSDVTKFHDANKPVIWITTSDYQSGFDSGKMRGAKLNAPRK